MTVHSFMVNLQLNGKENKQKTQKRTWNLGIVFFTHYLRRLFQNKNIFSLELNKSDWIFYSVLLTISLNKTNFMCFLLSCVINRRERSGDYIENLSRKKTLENRQCESYYFLSFHIILLLQRVLLLFHMS